MSINSVWCRECLPAHRFQWQTLMAIRRSLYGWTVGFMPGNGSLLLFASGLLKRCPFHWRYNRMWKCYQGSVFVIRHHNGCLCLVQVLQTYRTDEKMKEMVQNLDFYVTPVLNIDGYVYTWINESVSFLLHFHMGLLIRFKWWQFNFLCLLKMCWWIVLADQTVEKVQIASPCGLYMPGCRSQPKLRYKLGPWVSHTVHLETNSASQKKATLTKSSSSSFHQWLDPLLTVAPTRSVVLRQGLRKRPRLWLSSCGTGQMKSSAISQSIHTDNRFCIHTGTRMSQHPTMVNWWVFKRTHLSLCKQSVNHIYWLYFTFIDGSRYGSRQGHDCCSWAGVRSRNSSRDSLLVSAHYCPASIYILYMCYSWLQPVSCLCIQMNFLDPLRTGRGWLAYPSLTRLSCATKMNLDSCCLRSRSRAPVKKRIQEHGTSSPMSMTKSSLMAQVQGQSRYVRPSGPQYWPPISLQVSLCRHNITT